MPAGARPTTATPARPANDPLPLVVDLDGTLVRTDLLLECLFMLAKQNPLQLLLVPLWLAKGKACLKRRLAEVARLDVTTLPYRQALLERLDGRTAPRPAVGAGNRGRPGAGRRGGAPPRAVRRGSGERRHRQSGPGAQTAAAGRGSTGRGASTMSAAAAATRRSGVPPARRWWCRPGQASQPVGTWPPRRGGDRRRRPAAARRAILPRCGRTSGSRTSWSSCRCWRRAGSTTSICCGRGCWCSSRSACARRAPMSSTTSSTCRAIAIIRANATAPLRIGTGAAAPRPRARPAPAARRARARRGPRPAGDRRARALLRADPVLLATAQGRWSSSTCWRSPASIRSA